MLNDFWYRSVAGLGREEGGQELLLAEIISIFLENKIKIVWLPFNPHRMLKAELEKWHIKVLDDECRTIYFPDCAFDAVYFGTPTIVNNKPLFPNGLYPADKWNKNNERWYARRIRNTAERTPQCKLIVSGLGSGDISVEERQIDMGSDAKVVCYKDFDTFQDWIIARRIR